MGKVRWLQRWFFPISCSAPADAASGSSAFAIANESTPRLFGFGLMNAGLTPTAIGLSDNIGASGNFAVDHV
jgi:hypothetical protein